MEWKKRIFQRQKKEKITSEKSEYFLYKYLIFFKRYVYNIVEFLESTKEEDAKMETVKNLKALKHYIYIYIDTVTNSENAEPNDDFW